MPPTDTAGAALLYIVAAIERLRPVRGDDCVREITRHGDEKKIPGVKVGDFLYYVNDDDDDVIIGRQVVVGVLPCGECLVSQADIDCGFPRPPRYADSDDYLTPEEAILAWAEKELDYHEPRANAAKKAIKEVGDKEDISKYFSWSDVQ